MTMPMTMFRDLLTFTKMHFIFHLVLITLPPLSALETPKVRTKVIREKFRGEGYLMEQDTIENVS